MSKKIHPHVITFNHLILYSGDTSTLNNDLSNNPINHLQFKNINFSILSDKNFKKNSISKYEYKKLLLDSKLKLQSDAIKALNDLNFDNIVDTTKNEIKSIKNFYKYYKKLPSYLEK